MEKRKFKCLSCGQKFEVNDSSRTICPHCHSDNVTPSNSNMGKRLLAVFAFLLFVCLGFFLARCVRSKPVSDLKVDFIAPVLDPVTKTYSFEVNVANLQEGETVEYELCEEQDMETVISSSTNGLFKNISPSKNGNQSYWLYVTATLKDKTRNYSQEILGFVLPDTTTSGTVSDLIISNSEPKWDKKKETYSIDICVKDLPVGTKVTYELCETVEPKKVLQKSYNGKFTGIKPSDNQIHSYWFVATCANGSESKVVQKEIEGFIKIAQNDHQITKGELQVLINKQSTKLSGANSQISGNVKFKVSGAGPGESVQSFQDIFDFIGFDIWKSVTVTSIGYDEHNRVNSVSLSVTK